MTLTPLRQASSLWRKAIHASEQQASKAPSPSASASGLASAPPSLTLCHRGQSLLQESKQETTSKALCKSGRFPFGHADPAKNVTMQLVYLACLRFCLHVALALIHRRLPHMDMLVYVLRGLQATSSSVCSFTCNANKWPIPKTQVKLKAQFAVHISLFFFLTVGFAFILTVTYTILAQLIMYY